MTGASDRPLVVAVPKGRVLSSLAKLFEAAGVDTAALTVEDRTLVRSVGDGLMKFLLLKPDDVPTYVEYGAADLGVVGRDVLGEREDDLFIPLDLGIGACRLSVAGTKASAMEPPSSRPLRVATKFMRQTRAHFGARGVPVEVIHVLGSVEIAPLLGLADVIVDLVQSGETLRSNGLQELETIRHITSVVVANPVGFKLRRHSIRPLLERLQGAITGGAFGT